MNPECFPEIDNNYGYHRQVKLLRCTWCHNAFDAGVKVIVRNYSNPVGAKMPISDENSQRRYYLRVHHLSCDNEYRMSFSIKTSDPAVINPSGEAVIDL